MTDLHDGTQHNPYQSAYGQAASAQHAVHSPGTSAQQPHTASVVVPAHTVVQTKKSGGVRTFFTAFAGALLACILMFGFTNFSLLQNGQLTSNKTESLGSEKTTVVEINEQNPTLAEAVAAKCLPSVASITVYSTQSNQLNFYGFNFGSSGSGSLQESGLGSGVVLSSEGYIVTNNHVVSGGEKFKVAVGGNTYDADLVGSDPSADIAVLKARDASNLQAMEIGNSDDLTIGEWVMSIGSPFGLEQSVATGIVSAVSRSQIMDNSTTSGASADLTIYPNMIQTDAAINPGNSGGALVDANGQLIGINTLITSNSGNYSGVGFAIPVNYAVNLAQQIIDGKTPTHAQLGVSLTTINAAMAARYGLAVDEGAYVSAVTPGGGAANAGIAEGDIVTAFNGKAITSASDLMLEVRSKNPGDKVQLTVVGENGQQRTVDVTLGADDSSNQPATRQQSTDMSQLFGR